MMAGPEPEDRATDRLPPLDGGPPAAGRGPEVGMPRRRTLAAMLVAAALLGGGVGAGALTLTSAVGDGGGTTTIVRQEAPATAAAEATTAPPGSAAADGLDAGAIHARASAGVVDISATGGGATAAVPFGPRSQRASSAGSGFVVDEEGDVLTAAHVVDGATSLQVSFADGTTREARVAGTDDATDVAVLRIDPSGLDLQPLELGTSASLEVGDPLAVIGSPFGYRSSLSTGVVSGLDRTIDAPNGFTIAHAVQTDAALNPGNSGGPILDAQGRVVGIADQIATGGSDQSAGVGFAVPIDLVTDHLDELAAGREVAHAYLGVSTGESDRGAGALVAEVIAGGPAASAGLRTGDVVTAVDGEDVAGGSGLVAAISDADPGDELALQVQRGPQTLTVTATLGTQPATPTR